MKYKSGVLTTAIQCRAFLKDSFPSKFSGIKIIPTTEVEIKSIIQSLKSKNSSGYK
jgi:hypothetical protein